MLLQLHAVKDDFIDDQKKNWWFIDMSASVSDVVDVVSLSLSHDDVVEYPSC